MNYTDECKEANPTQEQVGQVTREKEREHQAAMRLNLAWGKAEANQGCGSAGYGGPSDQSTSLRPRNIVWSTGPLPLKPYLGAPELWDIRHRLDATINEISTLHVAHDFMTSSSPSGEMIAKGMAALRALGYTL